MAGLKRRDFLKVMGLSGTTAAVGCSDESARTLIPYIIPPEDIVPGEATWYATTCRECPAGCGLLAKNREGRVIKVEGNPQHPVNQGRLSAMGQASVQGLYNPERVKGPMRKNLIRGQWDPVSWEEGEAALVKRLLEIAEKGQGERVAFVTDLVTGTLKELMERWLSAFGSKTHLMYEPLAYEPLRQANRMLFGVDGIPTYRIHQADFLVSFGADFLGAWLSPVEHARQFAQFRSSETGVQGVFVHVGPRLSQTAANADQWISVPPGGDHLVAVGMLKIIFEEGLAPSAGAEATAASGAMLKDWSLEAIAGQTGVTTETLRTLAKGFARAKSPLALAGGLTCSGPRATDTAVAANLLCALFPGSRETVDWEDLSALGKAARASEMKELADRMRAKEIDLLLIQGANPAFSLPQGWEFAKAMQAVPLVVSFSPTLDETAAGAHLILPTHTPLESWGDHSPQNKVTGLMQPVMGPMFQTRHLGDILIAVGRKVKGGEAFPWPGFYEFLREAWRKRGERVAPGASFESFWQEALRRGGLWVAEGRSLSWPSLRSQGPSLAATKSKVRAEGVLPLVTYPTVQFLDGRGANRPWLQELPEPVTQITWGNWVEIHPETAARMGIQKGDLLYLKSSHGSIVVPAFPYEGAHRDLLAMPMGQGHTAYGLFADGQPGNPAELLSPDLDESGSVIWCVSEVRLERSGKEIPLAHTDGSLYQHGRKLAQTVGLEEYEKARAEGRKPHLRLPLPEGYDPQEDFYPAHKHEGHRWAMVVDLDRCVGCGACAVACSAENNVAIVGKNQVLKGREMSWLRVERYWEAEEPHIRFLPMLCQHCDNAPCEPVCPVFAPHHSPEGLNNQIYNRCVGTRFCSQNCPYKVRRFNWFTFTRPEPLNWQLNPDVTVRQKGVMEKCSFCVQRIKWAKNWARVEGRKLRDGDVVPACAQTCPANALVFGDLVDPESRASRMIRSPRAYQVLVHLNTKPAVFYLKRVTRGLTV